MTYSVRNVRPESDLADEAGLRSEVGLNRRGTWQSLKREDHS